MSDTTTTEATTAAKPKPPVLDSKDNELKLNIRVKVLGEKYQDAEGKPLVGTVTGLEYQRQRAVIQLDNGKAIVRPAKQTWVKKSKSGKVEFDTERAARAVRAGRKAKNTEPAEATAE